MKIGSPLPHKKARIEIIPLIDIMFFLLASFMMVSLTMVKLKSIKMDLPTATQATKDFKPEIVNISVDKQGDIYIDAKRQTLAEMYDFLIQQVAEKKDIPVYISGDKAASHGAVINVLDMVRRAGVQKVSFAIASEGEK